jgi:hypothetical protein
MEIDRWRFGEFNLLGEGQGWGFSQEKENLLLIVQGRSRKGKSSQVNCYLETPFHNNLHSLFTVGSAAAAAAE